MILLHIISFGKILINIEKDIVIHQFWIQQVMGICRLIRKYLIFSAIMPLYIYMCI